MKIEFLDRFSRDIDRIDNQSVGEKIANIIELIESAHSLSDLHNIKKLKGFKSAYRIRIGDYRIGIFFENNTVEFARIAHRRDIYKIFP